MPKPPRVPRPEGEIYVRLRQQFQYLRRSCDIYDAGHWDEAPRLATALRVLVHHKGPSHALLHQLGLADTIRMHDASLHPDTIMASQQAWLDQAVADGRIEAGAFVAARPLEAGLAVPEVGPAGNYMWVPRLDRHPLNPPASLADWWAMKIIDGEDQLYSRSDVVTIMANQEGGAHVDTELDEAYYRLRESVTFTGAVFTGPVDVDALMAQGHSALPAPDGNIVEATVRQIAYEMLVTLAREMPAVVRDAS